MPPSFAQERLWFIDRLAPGSPLYNLAGGVRLTGFLDVAAFARSLREIVRRHESLRTTLPELDGRPVQRISMEASLGLPVIDLSGLPERSGELWRLTVEESRRPFDLARGPLLRSTLVRLGEADHAVLLTIHHIVADGWSMDVFVRELGALYRAFVQGRPSPLPELPVQYADVAVWQRLQGEALERQLGWWRRELAGAPALTELPGDRQRPAVQSFRGRLAQGPIPAGLATDLEALARREGASLFMVLLAGLFALIRAEDMVVGSPVANRNRSETEGLIGFFANTLALRARLRPDMTFRELLAQVKATALGAYANQDVPFERVVEDLQVPRSLGWNPLFQVMLVLQSATTAVLDLPGARLERMEPWSETAKLDLSFSFEEAGPALRITAEYSTDLYEEATVVRIMDHLRGLLERAAGEPEMPVADLPVFAGSERKQVETAGAALQDRLAERERRLAALRSRMSDTQRAALGHLRSKSPVQGIPRREGDGPAPLSFAQERLWFFDRLQPGGSSYTIPAALRLRGWLDVDALARALAEIVRRHESLRTTFAERDGEGVQIVSAPFVPALPVIDLRMVPEEARRLLATEAGRPFDLSTGPLFRALLVRLGPDDQVVLLNMHHIVSDNWSMEVLVRECTLLYQTFAQGRPSPLPELPIQYPDFAVWQREHLRGEVLEAQLSYWREELAGAPALLELPTDRPRPPVQTFRGAVLTSVLPAELADGLRQSAKRQDATLFMILMAGLQALLGRLTGQEDVLVGSPIANRNRLEVEGLIGFFVNTLVMRGRLEPGLSFPGFMERVRRAALDAYAHQDLPFEKLVEDLHIPRSLAYNPLFQVMFAVQNAGAGAVELPGLSVSPFDFEIGTSVFDLGFGVNDAGTGPLEIVVELRTDLFDVTTVRRLVDRYRLLLEAAAADPDMALADLPLLAASERHQLLVEWGGVEERAETAPPYPVPRLFEERAARSPGAIAVEHNGRSVTYRELDLRSDRIAVRLGALGVGPEERVGLLVERTPDLAAAILGIWKAGGAYVPLDPSLPAERLAYMISDSAPRVLLTQRSLEDLRAGLPVGNLEILELEAVGESGRTLLRRDPEPGDLAYLIYTSGTTGRPKAVQVEHGSLSHTMRAAQEAFGFSATDRIPCLAPFSFDIFLFELLGPLLAGGTSVLFDLRPTLDVPALAASLDRMTLLHAVPALMREVVERVGENTTLRRVFVGGDAVPPDLLSDLRRTFPAAVATVLYGPTEATIICSRYEAVGERFEDRNLLGRPLPGAVLRVMDAPIGVPGELWIGGPGVTRGYRGQEELTAEKFVERDGRRWYRTGDLARWLADGNLEFLGRIDNQVKVRGFRIELGEIEATLAEHPAVRQVVMLAVGEGEAKRLVAYVVASEDMLPALRGRVSDRLPEYMMPAAWVFLDELPVTSHGKVDRRALARIEPGIEAGSGEAPRTETEERLAALWSGLLGVERVGTASDFFDLGGHSLLATRLSSRVREAFGVELPLRAFFEASVLSDQARRIDEATMSSAPPIPRRTDGGPAPLSFAQERLWFIDRLTPGSPLYNMPSALRLTGEVDVALLETALREIAHRHEVLRATFLEIDGEPRQVVDPEVRLRLPVIDLRALPDSEAEALRLAAEEAVRPFDLRRGPLLRAGLVRLDERDWLALFNLHHIAGDGWSFGILVQELSALYAGRSLPGLPVQYADFAAWQRQWLQDEVLEAQLAWWRAELDGAPALLELPTDRPRPAVQSYRGAVEAVALPANLAASLAEVARREGATLFMTLLAGFEALLARYTGQDDLLVGSPVAGRGRLELEGLIGFFVNTLVLRGRLADAGFQEILGRVRTSALGAFAHQDLPFERLVEELRVERSLAHSPLVQVTFALQNLPSGAVELPGLLLAPADAQGSTAKFDLTLSLSETGGTLTGGVEYASDLFDRATIVRLLGHFETLLAGAVEDPGRHLEDLPLLTPGETRQILGEWNATEMDLPKEPVHLLFERQARERPDAPAVVSAHGSLTYGELDRGANRLARRLRRLGVGPETVVAVCIPRSPELVLAELAVLKAGGAYLPLDPSHPEERLAYTVADSGALLLLREVGDLADESEEPLEPAGHTDLLAYVIYTSGSTGAPKGTELTHAGLSNLTAWHRRTYGPGAGDRTTLLAGPGFDASVWEVWPALASGAALHVPPQETVASPPDLVAWMAAERITQSFLPTPLAEAVLAEPLPAGLELRVVVTGGDRLHRRPSADAPFALVNHYGPTEGTVVATADPVDPSGDRMPAIGRPIANVRVYLLDRALGPVPAGVPGELFVAGAGLARGYRNRPDLTAERFAPDPFGGLTGKSGERLYRTGDLARFLPGGEIEFLGRLDHQVKIRGFRVELGEIEAVLAQSPGVREAAVLARDGRLVAYVVTSPPVPSPISRPPPAGRGGT
ncbi:MAG TPA: amino acid adenylation domain-containing protein [Thermoanaerobaculia bacterium]|nr:amino acid adenylation domain-containing protein [Thermoanaerobaculia bacterium]